MTDVATIPDPTSTVSEPDRYWTTANIGEATPDVLSAMCWSFWGPQAEMAARRSYHEFGILSRRELDAPDDPNELMTSYFFGRPALNVDVLRPFFGSLPGVSADDFERDMCGHLRPNLSDASRRSRLPIIIVRGAIAMKRTPKRLEVLVPEQRRWWETDVRDRTDVADPLDRLADAADRYRTAFEIHCCGRFVLMSAQATISRIATEAERPELILDLIGGLGGVTETALARDMWAVSRHQLTLDEFVARHGFHGPNEGNLDGRSWREDPSPLVPMIERLADRPDDQHPDAREHRAGSARTAALEELHRSLTTRKRRSLTRTANALVAATRANELGKASFLMAIDGGRAAVRDHGARLVADGVIDDPEDAFSFTMAELSMLGPDAREIVAVRQQRRADYRSMTLPVTFTGNPEPSGSTVETDRSLALSGAPGSPGQIRGRARVIVDASATGDLEPGEVLVCRSTDPSWTPAFMLAEALVIDIGGPTSHGAIVARELGIPCVIGVGDATSRIATGDVIDVDGSTGAVTMVETAASR